MTAAVAGGTSRIRAASISRSVSGSRAPRVSSPPPSGPDPAPAATSASTNRALPPDRAAISAAIRGRGGDPRIPPTWSATSCGDSGPRSTRSPPGDRSSSTSHVPNPGSSPTASVRSVASSATRSLRRLPTRYVRRSRVASSAQWMSSTTRSTGRSAPSRPRKPSTSSNRRARPARSAAVPGEPAPGSPSPARSGTSRASSGRAGPSTRSRAAGVSSSPRWRRAPASGAYGSPPSAIARHLPTSAWTSVPGARTSSAVSRVFPIPASPATSTKRERPPAASATAARRRASSPSRPTSRALDARTAIARR